ncbi:GYDIA family GHMP kinase [Myroides sp. LJL119]
MQDLSFYSNGKLLLTGEYVVLDGVKALALPCKTGQSMQVIPNGSGFVNWTGFNSDGTFWMQENIKISDILKPKGQLNKSAYYKVLLDVLVQAHLLNPEIFTSNNSGFEVRCYLTFPRLWGLGSSSTWISNVAQWFNINPYELLNRSFKGSGYDIACATSDGPIWYTRNNITPEIQRTDLSQEITKDLYFVYLNNKQDSKQGIANYRANKTQNNSEFLNACQQIQDISEQIPLVKNLKEFHKLVSLHENIISSIIKEQCVKDKFFSDFPGAIKSLGAWGGDFILVGSDTNPKKYFMQKGYNTILSYQDMIL